MIAALMMVAGVMVCAEPARATSPGTRDLKSELTPEARPFNERGVALVQAGAYAEGVVELERAYALLPDPLLHRAGRSKVLGSLRSALVSLHAATGDPAHLERLRGHLLRYLEELLFALGDRATADDAAGGLAALREVTTSLAQQRPLPPRPGVSKTDRPVQAGPRRVVAATPRSIEVPRVALDRGASVEGRRLGLAGAVLMGVGVAGVGVMTGMVVGVADSRGKLRGLTSSLAEPGSTASPMVWEEGRELHERAGVYRTVAVLSGVLGAAGLGSGIAVMVVGKRRARGLAHRRVTPLLAPGVAGAVLGGEF